MSGATFGCKLARLNDLSVVRHLIEPIYKDLRRRTYKLNYLTSDDVLN